MMSVRQTASLLLSIAVVSVHLACGGTGGTAIGEVVPTTSVPGVRSRVGLATAQGQLYAVGGVIGPPGDDTPEVLTAPIGTDGRLGDWRETTPLPVPRVAHAVTSDRQSLYVIGGCPAFCGADELDDMKRVFRGALASDGSVQAWEESGPLPESRWLHTAVSHGGFVYVLGGAGASATTWRARIGGDGRLGPWTGDQPLLKARKQHASLVIGQHLYVGGGFEQDRLTQAPGTDIEVSTIQADGSLGAWTTIPGAAAIQEGALAEYALANETGRARSSYAASLPLEGESTQLVDGNRFYQVYLHYGAPGSSNPTETRAVFVRFQ